MAVLLPNKPQQQKEESDFDKVLKALQVAGQITGVYGDFKKIDQMKADNALKLEEAKRQRELFKISQNKEKRDQTLFDQKQEGRLSPEDLSKFEVSENPGAGFTEAKDFQGRTIFIKPRAPVKDPFAQELVRQRLEEAKRKAEEAAFKKTPKGRLQNMPAGDKQRYDNVVAGISSLAGMERALANGDWTVRPVGSNDFTRNKNLWKEAIGRMQSGGAINKEEARSFIELVPGPLDSAEQQQKKLAQMRSLMEQRFGTFGFDKSNAEDLGLDPVALGWANPPETQQQQQMSGGSNAAYAAPPEYTLDSLLKERQIRDIRQNGLRGGIPGRNR